MDLAHFYIALAEGVKLLFVVALGACIGSLTNVLVYRLPRGIGVVTPASRCPACGTKLSWRDNIPVLGWIFLRGRCRYCKARISPEYPLVEAFVGVLFGAIYALWYMTPVRYELLGIELGGMKPEWARAGLIQTWPMFLVVLTLVGSLVAMTIVDAKTFTIPLILTWVPAVLGVLVHPAYALWVQLGPGELIASAEGWRWVIATPGPMGWKWVGAALGGVAGLGISLVLLRAGVLRRSFEDYEEWETKALREAGIEPEQADEQPSDSAGTPIATDPDSQTPEQVPDDGAAAEDGGTETVQQAAPGGVEVEQAPARTQRRRLISMVLVTMGVTAVAGGMVAGSLGVAAGAGVLVGLLAGPVLGGLLFRATGGRLQSDDSGAPEGDEDHSPHEPGQGGEPVAADGTEDVDEQGGQPESAASPSQGISPADLWIQYPHARREMGREIAFLAPAVLLAFVGALVAVWLSGPWEEDFFTGRSVTATQVPLWLDALSGSLLGYLAGGGVVWAVRILGTLAFGKEAMGLGDVHLMGAVGACLGWIDPVLAFFAAAFVGVYWTLVMQACSGGVRRAMPFGPFLAVGTLLVLFSKPWIAELLSGWWGRSVVLP